MTWTKWFSNVCIKHRSEQDHNWQGRPKSKLLTDIYKKDVVLFLLFLETR